MAGRPRVLLVGGGGYGTLYLKELTGHDTGADIVGICDISPDIEKKIPLIEERCIPVYHSLEAFYARDTADLAIIVSPVHYHTEMTLACFANGSNVLCEKPLCLTEEEAKLMAEASRASGKFLSLGYQLNYRRDVLALKRDILAGKFGLPKRLSVFHCYRRGAKYYARNNWAGRIAVDGREVFDSPFTNASAHNFQLMTFLLGDSMRTACDVASVEAELYRGNPNVENYDIAALRFFTPDRVPILYYTAHPIKSVELGPCGVFEFEKGTINFDSERPSFKAAMNDGSMLDYTVIDPGHRMQKLYDALACVKNGGEPVCGVEADYPHIRAVRMVQQQPIPHVRDNLRYTIEANGDTYMYIRDLEEIFVQSASAWALPCEIGYALSAQNKSAAGVLPLPTR